VDNKCKVLYFIELSGKSTWRNIKDSYNVMSEEITKGRVKNEFDKELNRFIRKYKRF
jgi:hypothetical protein